MLDSDQLALKEVQVVLTDAAMRGELRLKPCPKPAMITDELCRHHLEAAGVLVTDEIAATLEQGLAAYRADPRQTVTIPLHGQPATTGDDGRLEWAKGCNPTHLHGGGSAELQPIDHYQRTSYVVVTTGQSFLRIVAPTQGTPGRDLTGRSVASKPGRPVSIGFGNGVLQTPDGTCRATYGGILMFDDRKVWVDPSLRVPGYVDFSTGNIDYDGNVEIEKGIRDLFKVKVTGHVIVHGLIEAAELDVGGDLVALGGMAGKEKGRATVAGCLRARYLNTARVQVRGDAHIEREVINCELEILGQLHVPRGSVIGGTCHVANKVQTATLGSPAGIATCLHLGSAPRHEKVHRAAVEMLERLRDNLSQMDEQLKALESAGGRRNAYVQESMTELMFSRSQLMSRITDLDRKREAIARHLAEVCKPDMIVEHVIQAGVTLMCRGRVAIFDAELRGPVWIGWSRANSNLIYRHAHDHTIKPLSAVTCSQAD